MTSPTAGATPARAAKLYAISRRDLKPGLRAAQLGHAVVGWTLQHGPPPDNLVLLEVRNRQELEHLATALDPHDTVCFREPDLDHELTAVAVSDSAYRLLSSLPLAFRSG